MTEHERTHPVSAVLDRLEGAADAGPPAVAAGSDGTATDATVTVEAIVERMGTRSFAALLLVPALIMVSPISTIPGTPTLSAAIIALIAAQMLVGRRSLWLPRILRERRLRQARLERAVAFLRRPVGWVEPLMRPRLALLAEGPGAHVALLVCLGVTAVMPVMEFLPILASVAAVAISLIAAGLLARDGLLVCAGYAVVATGVLIARSFLLGAQQL